MCATAALHPDEFVLTNRTMIGAYAAPITLFYFEGWSEAELAEMREAIGVDRDAIFRDFFRKLETAP